MAPSCKSLAGVITLLLFNLTSCLASRCPMKECTYCVPANVHDAPGIGFDLSFSYGTSAVHWYDGTVTNGVKITASEEYISLLQRLSNSPVPPEQSRYEKWRRWWNKKTDLPSTPDVGILSALIRDLARATASELSLGSINKVVVSVPLLTALTREDLNDAIEYAGLLHWLDDKIWAPKVIAGPRAVFAGNGYNLCHDYKNLYHCQDESERMPRETVYTITYTRRELYTSLDKYNAPFQATTNEERHLLDFETGLDSLAAAPSPSEFWSLVKRQLQALPRRDRRRITKIILAGETVTEPKFLETLRDALSEVTSVYSEGLAQPMTEEVQWRMEKYPEGHLALADDLDTEKIIDPVFAAARGAALYARWRQEAPYECVEKKECFKKREREREGQNMERLELR